MLVRFAAAAAWWASAAGLVAVPARAQFFPPPTGELSATVYVDKVDAAARTHLEQVETYLAGQQWDEAIETLRQLQQTHGGKVVNLTPTRYVNLRDYCHLRILQMGPPGLELYRQRVDPTAETWYRQASQRRDATLLARIVDELFCSSWTDQALLALGELALEAGDYDSARRHWERIVPSPPADQPPQRLAMPDTDLSLTDVRARLVLTSILEGSYDRAADELAAFDRLHPGAEGRLAGRKVAYAPVLKSLLEASREWPRAAQTESWSTLGGSPLRQTAAPKLAALGALEWREKLESPPPVDAAIARNLGFRPRRVAEDNDQPLCYHPVVYGQTLLVGGPTGISAYDLATGKPAWRNPIFSDVEGIVGRQRIINRSSIGAPRYTLTVHGDRLYARMGSPLTSQASEVIQSGSPGYIVCLDLKQQGKEMWRRTPPEEGWAFDGTPVADDQRVYAAMRRTDVRPQAHVACFDAETGRPLWSQKVSAAETPARGQVDEVTHNLLTLERGTLYFNTNLGTVAALDGRDGQIRWITQYRRTTHSDLSRPAAQFYRDLTPAVFAAGRLFVAPSDSPSILSLDAATGQMLWETEHAEDAVHVLGVQAGRLLVSGDRLWWIDAETGQVVRRWPDGPNPRGYGRGLLAGSQVFFPCREEIHVFDAASGRPAAPVQLTAQFEGVNGGNLILADERLVLTTANRLRGHELIVFSPYSRLRKKFQEEITAQPLTPLPYVRLAKCEWALGNAAEALDLLQRADVIAAPQRGLEAALVKQLVRRQRFEVWMQRGEERRQAADWDGALADFDLAQSAAPAPTLRLTALLAAADTATAAGHVEAARQKYQALDGDAALRLLPVARDADWTVQAGTLAQSRLEQLDANQSADLVSENGPRQASFAAALPHAPPLASYAAGAGRRLPLRRATDRTWTSPLWALGTAVGQPRQALRYEPSQVQLVSLEDGSALWSAPADQPPLWAGAADGLVVWLTAERACAARAADGAAVWQTPLPRGFPLAHGPGRVTATDDQALTLTVAQGESLLQAALAAGRLVVRQPAVGLVALDTATGATAWSYAPDEGRLSGELVVTEDELLVTLDNPSRIVALDLASGQSRGVWAGAGHPRRAPLPIDGRRVLAVSAVGQIQMWDRIAGQRLWSRELPTPAGAYDPDLLAAAGRVVVYLPGQGLSCWDANDGRLRWRSDLSGDVRATSQSQALAGADDQAVYAVCDSRLRALALDDGRLLWQQPLSDEAAAWRVERLGDSLACWPRWAPGRERLEVWLLSAVDGQLRQQLSLAAAPERARVAALDDRLVIGSPERSWLLAP